MASGKDRKKKIHITDLLTVIIRKIPATFTNLHFRSSCLFSADVMLGGMSEVSTAEENKVNWHEAQG